MTKLDDLRRTFRVGMSKTDFFFGCDDLLPELTMPTLDKNVVGIKVEEGGVVLFFLSDEKGLVYAEYEGGVFME